MSAGSRTFPSGKAREQATVGAGHRRRRDQGRMNAVPEGFRPADHTSPYMDLIGRLYESGVGEDYRLGMRVEEHHTNRIGQCHGAVLAAVADVHLLRVIALSQRPRLMLVTVHLGLDYLSPAPLGSWIEGRARIDRIGRSLCHSSGTIYADGKPVLRASGVFHRVRKTD
jgi:acyl-coenzyme A thioesterase 13